MIKIGFILTVLFIILKAFDLIEVTWLQSFLPLIVGISLEIIIFTIIAIAGMYFTK